MDPDATMKLVTNLDRAEIESRLQSIRVVAENAGFPAVAAKLAEAPGKGAKELDAIIQFCLQQLGPDEEVLASQLELVQINLPNLG